MIKNKQFIKNEIKNLSGNLLLIGEYEEDIISKIEKNDKIINCNIMSNSNTKSEDNNRKRQKKINIKKIKKVFKKNKIDYIIGDMNDLQKYLKTFVKDSVYINKGKIYLLVSGEYDYEYLLKMYHRYNVTVDIKKYSDGNIIIINTEKSKNHPFKNILFSIKDTIFIFLDKIGDYLAS